MDDYFNWADALGEEEEESLQVAKHLHFLHQYSWQYNSPKYDMISVLNSATLCTLGTWNTGNFSMAKVSEWQEDEAGFSISNIPCSLWILKQGK